MVYLSCAILPRLSWKRDCLMGVAVVMVVAAVAAAGQQRQWCRWWQYLACKSTSFKGFSYTSYGHQPDQITSPMFIKMIYFHNIL